MTSREPIQLTADAEACGQRVDRFLALRLPDVSRSRVTALIREGEVVVNGRAIKPSHELNVGDLVTVTLPEAKPVATVAQDIPLTVLYEDEDLAVLDKSSGMVVHPGAGHEEGTIVNALLHRFGPLSSIGGEQRPGIVHRLDKETSGCLVVARNDATHAALSAQFAGRETEKLYYAVVEGHPSPETGRIENFMARHPTNRVHMAVVPEGHGRHAVTDYHVVHSGPHWALVRCTLHTGRTHQIRVHLKSLGHPLLGDDVYAKPRRQLVAVPRLMLHAWRLGFTHPRTSRRLVFTAPLPPEFEPFLPSAPPAPTLR
ncbi:MAG: RluA family pseudouridine synthase [Verrucomicrobiales bacterium]